MRRKPDAPLTEKQQNFVNLFAIGTLSATQAYIQAGFAPNSASVEASKALARPKIQEALKQRKAALSNTVKRSPVTPEWIANRLADIAVNPDAPHAAQVTALRTLADFQGMLNGGQQQSLPEPVQQLLGAIGAGYRKQQALEEPHKRETVTVEARVIEESDEPEGTGTS